MTVCISQQWALFEIYGLMKNLKFLGSEVLKYLFESGGSWVMWFVVFNFFMHKITHVDWQISLSVLPSYDLLSCDQSVKSEKCIWFLLSYVNNKLFYVSSKNMKLFKFFIYKKYIIDFIVSLTTCRHWSALVHHRIKWQILCWWWWTAGFHNAKLLDRTATCMYLNYGGMRVKWHFIGYIKVLTYAKWLVQLW